MKYFVLAICVASLMILAHGVSDADKDKLKQFHDECQADPATHVDEDLLKKARNGEHVEGVGKHSLCLSKKLGFQKENGDLDKESIKSSLSKYITEETKVKEILDKCAVQKLTPELTAENLLRCLFENRGHSAHRH
ncbi:hypothetical protein NQ317_011938 [Molorchus minor]|uniref:Uncharacterized protein n=1 Tax=Molorchus minor TaxID=1323400 RepID=A0ABQ9IUH9_9CUCU|nr:hypothetical protein NQ317_011938 [Molorchus minor]